MAAAMEDRESLQSRWLGEVPVHAAAWLWAGICLWLLGRFGISFKLGNVTTNGILIFAAMFVYANAMLLGSLARHRPAHPIAFLRQRFVNLATAQTLLASIPLLLIGVVLLPLFSSMKSMIPLFTDYTWDATFAEWDRAIFLGIDPWKLLWPLLGNPWVTATMAVFYHLWILLLYLGSVFVILDGRVSSFLRRRYFLSYVLTWALLGCVMATAFASVGPVFAQTLVGLDSFAPQLDLLRSGSQRVPLMTLPVQDMLLERFYADERGLGSGITAMPSLHVAIAFLFWLTMRQLDRHLGRVCFAFFAIIWVSSVHLAYHYAIDGLASVLGVLVIWWASSLAIKGWDRWLTLRGQPTLRTNTVPAE